VHPILLTGARLRLYLAAWLPIAGLLATLMVFGKDLPWSHALALSVPLSLVYAFACLASWYLCRLYPLKPARVVPLLGVHLISACLASSLWTAAGKAWALGLAHFPQLAGVTGSNVASAPLLFGAGVLLYLLAATVHYLLAAFESAREMEKRALEFKLLSREAGLRALRAQIHPHFLFNSLNSISALTSVDPRAARRMCLLLAEFLRKSLKVAGMDTISLGEELTLVESFLSIEQVRLGSRLTVDQKVEESCRSCKVPPLLLQPLVENAVNHGVAEQLDGGSIRLQIGRDKGQLRILLENSCDPDRPRGRGNGVGLANVRGRLQALFESEAGLHVQERNGLFTVEITLPFVTVSPSSSERKERPGPEGFGHSDAP